MTDSVLPTDSEELGELVVSGEMASQQIDEFIEKHGHYAAECDEVCGEIYDSFDDYPLSLLLEHNVEKMTVQQCLLVHENLSEHISPEDQGTRANVASEKLELSVGRGLLAYVCEDLEEWMDEESLDRDRTFSGEEIQQRVKGYIFKLATFPECNEETLEKFVAAYHYPGNWESGGLNCDGEVEACDSCQDMLREAVAKLK